MEIIDQLLSSKPPGPGSGPKRSNRTGHSRIDLATVVALCVLLHGRGQPRDWPKLLAGTAWRKYHSRANGFGDAGGRKHLGLDRGRRDAILLDQANLIRCAHWLRDHRKANETVALYFPGVIQPGDDLVAFVRKTLSAKSEDSNAA